MKCENYLCIYELDGDCTLKEISLNVTGTCEDCIYPSINRDYLAMAKESLLIKLENESNI